VGKCGRFWKIIRGCQKGENLESHQRNSHPILVYEVLRPCFTLFVGLEITPSVTTAIVDEQSPTIIVCERFSARDRDTELAEHDMINSYDSATFIDLVSVASSPLQANTTTTSTN
jgi:hypothetical protein